MVTLPKIQKIQKHVSLGLLKCFILLMLNHCNMVIYILH